MKSYQQYLEDLAKTFNKIDYTIILKAQNQFANALTTLAFMVEIPEGVWTPPLEIEQSYELVHKGRIDSSIIAIKEEGIPWYYDIIKFLKLGVYPNSADKRKCRLIRMMAISYVEVNSIRDPMIVYTFII